MRTELESQQEKLKHSLEQEKGNAICETRARILVWKHSKSLYINKVQFSSFVL